MKWTGRLLGTIFGALVAIALLVGASSLFNGMEPEGVPPTADFLSSDAGDVLAIQEQGV